MRWLLRRIRCAFHLAHTYDYGLLSGWRDSAEYRGYFEDDYTPKSAVEEDFTYG